MHKIKNIFFLAGGCCLFVCFHTRYNLCFSPSQYLSDDSASFAPHSDCLRSLVILRMRSNCRYSYAPVIIDPVDRGHHQTLGYVGPGGLRAPPVVADEAKLAIAFTYFFSTFFYAFCFSPTSGKLPCLKICFPHYFGITRRNKYF